MKKLEYRTVKWGKNNCMSHTYQIPALQYTRRELTRNMIGKWIRVGQVAVDSARLTIIDPCYCKLLSEKEEESILWDSEHASMVQYHFPLGHAGLGVSVRTGYGDGLYDVYGLVKDTGMGIRITEIKIKFV